MDAVLSLIRPGRTLGASIAHPCESFSKARRAPQWSRMPHQLRSSAHVSGLPDLLPKDRSAAELGNALLAASMRIMRELIAHGVPFVVENPRSSYLWEMPSMKKLLGHRSVCTAECDQCMYGCAWKKPTRFLLSDGMPASHLSKTCRGLRGRCARTKQKHYVLSGFADGAWRTTQAKVYSNQLCSAIVSVFVDHWRLRHMERNWKAASPPLRI